MGLSTALLYDNLQIDSYSYLFDMVAGRFVFGKYSTYSYMGYYSMLSP